MVSPRPGSTATCCSPSVATPATSAAATPTAGPSASSRPTRPAPSPTSSSTWSPTSPSGTRTPPDGNPGKTWNGGTIDSAALNSTRGAAALALGDLLAEDADRLPLAEPALQQLVTGPQPEVRASTIAARAQLLYTDPDHALALFHDAVNEVTDELLGSRYVEHFLNHAIRRGRYLDVAATLRRMLAAADDETRKVAARQLAIASYHAPDLDSNVDAVLRGGDDTARAAAVEVFADNVTYPPRLDRSMAVIAAALHDPGQDRPRCRRTRVLRPRRRTSPRLCPDDRRAGRQPRARRRRRRGPALAGDIPPAAPPGGARLCEAFVTAHQRDIGDIATSAAGDAMYVVRLALRMHAQHTDPDLRRRCLDLIDQLVAFRAHDIERDLDTIER